MNVKLREVAIGIALLVVSTTAVPRSLAQTSELANLFRDLEATSAGAPDPFDKADPVLDKLMKADEKEVVGSLPLITQAASDPSVSVRRVAAMSLYKIATRPDGHTLLSQDSATFAPLLVDPDIPIRRLTMLAIATLRPDATSPMVPYLKTYLAREDAVPTIGAFVATVLMEACPDDVDTTNVVVRFMQRPDQNTESEETLLKAISYRVKSHNLEIAREVARYADNPNEQLSVRAIQTLQGMGRIAVSNNQQSLSQIAADSRKKSSVRAAAAKALLAAQ